MIVRHLLTLRYSIYQDEDTYLAHVHYTLFDICRKACMYYHICCVGVMPSNSIGGSFSTRHNGREGRDDENDDAHPHSTSRIGNWKSKTLTSKWKVNKSESSNSFTDSLNHHSRSMSDQVNQLTITQLTITQLIITQLIITQLTITQLTITQLIITQLTINQLIIIIVVLSIILFTDNSLVVLKSTNPIVSAVTGREQITEEVKQQFFANTGILNSDIEIIQVTLTLTLTLINSIFHFPHSYIQYTFLYFLSVSIHY